MTVWHSVILEERPAKPVSTPCGFWMKSDGTWVSVSWEQYVEYAVGKAMTNAGVPYCQQDLLAPTATILPTP